MSLEDAAINDCNASTISEPFEREGEPGVWSIEEIFRSGEYASVLFCGENAEARCREYWAVKYGN